jgi:cytochrome b561
MGGARYTGVAIVLHWLVALLVPCGFALGLYMVDLPFSPRKLSLYSYHKWIGVTVFALAVARIAWRLGHPPPPLPPAVARWQVAASRAVHFLLYVCLVAAPLSGWLYSSATGVPTVPFGIKVLQLPDLVSRDRELAITLKFVHLTAVFTLAALVVLHVAAALKHQLVDRDGIIGRMLPARMS